MVAKLKAKNQATKAVGFDVCARSPIQFKGFQKDAVKGNFRYNPGPLTNNTNNANVCCSKVNNNNNATIFRSKVINQNPFPFGPNPFISVQTEDNPQGDRKVEFQSTLPTPLYKCRSKASAQKKTFQIGF